jgi:hypothetical protein
MSAIPLQFGQFIGREMRRYGGYLFLVVALAIGNPVTAAQIQVEQFGPEQAFLIVVNGQLQNGDDVIFGSMADKVGQAVVSLNSPGGSLIAGIESDDLFINTDLKRWWATGLSARRPARSRGWVGGFDLRVPRRT